MGGVTKVLGAFGVAAFSVQKGVQIIGKAIKSNQATSDAFEQSIAGWNAGIDVFFKNIATGNFDNFFRDISNAIKAGEQYAKTLDDLGDRNRALAISEVELLREIAKEENVRQDQTKSNEERLKSAERVNDLQLQLLEERQTEIKKAFDAEVDFITQKLKFNKDELLNFLSNYREEEKIRQQAQDLLKEET